MTVKKTKDIKEERFNKIVTILLVIIMVITLIESIRSRLELSKFINYNMGTTEECALEDTSLE